MFESLTLEDCFKPDFWPTFAGFALVVPKGDILPVRAAYNGKTWGIGVNPVTSDEPLWYSLADCAASALLTGAAPKALRVIMARDRRWQCPVALVLSPRQGKSRSNGPRSHGHHHRGAPAGEDGPFPSEVEQKRLMRRPQGGGQMPAPTASISEFNARTRRKGESTKVEVFGRKDPFFDRVPAPEDPGAIASRPSPLDHRGCRLMLAMLERCVTDLGGTLGLLRYRLDGHRGDS